MHAKYIDDCRLLRALARVLDLPAVATTTAFTYLHRIRLGDHAVQLTSQDLVTACIYVAAKVEEVHVSANQLINSARIISHPTQQQLLQSLAPLHSTLLAAAQQQTQQHTSTNDQQQQQRQLQQQHTVDDGPAAAKQQQPCSLPQQQQDQVPQQQESAASLAVVGNEYYQAKDALFMAEQVVLRTMNFQLQTPQPHKHLFNFCQLLNVSQAMAAAAVCLLNDVIAYTDLCIKAKPSVLAAAVLQCTTELMLGSKGSGSAVQQVAGANNHQLEQRDVKIPNAQPPNAVTGSPPQRGNKLQQHCSPDHDTEQHHPHQHDPEKRQQHGQSTNASGPLDHERQQQQQQMLHPLRQREDSHHRRRHRHAPDHSVPDKPGNHPHCSKHCSIPDAVLDGTWVNLLGLQLQEVARVMQQLKGLLTTL